MVYGNEEKELKPNRVFVDECEKYPGLLDIIQNIEGIVNKRSQHASGVIIYNNSPFDTTAFMRSPNGDLTTQFSLHDSESLGDTKFDFLLTEICDKITNAISLLQQDELISKDLTLREAYNKYLHPSVLDITDTRLWDALASGTVQDVFQFNTDVGLQGVKTVKPRTPYEMMMTNALIRLTGEKGKERPMDRYVRMKGNIQNWYDECETRGLSKEEVKILEPYYLPTYATPTTQEKLMLLCMDEKIAHFSLTDANLARKVCAKKQLSKIPGLKEKFVNQCPNKNFGEYVWQTAIEPQMSYAFAEPHALAYSFVGIQTLYLATNYPVIYWNCACLITNSDATDLYQKSIHEEVKDEYDEEIVDIYEPEDLDEYVYEDSPDHKTKKKKKIRTINYGKVATAIGQFQNSGITITPPNINHSSYTFSPDCEHNAIVCGLYGITRISADLVNQIIVARPYTSVEDFQEKVKVNRTQMLNLLKCGAFDSLCPDRIKAIEDYLTSKAGLKTKLTLANIPMLMKYKIFEDEEELKYVELYSYNKFLRKHIEDGIIHLPAKAMNYYCEHFDADLLIDDESIEAKVWEKQYKKAMAPFSEYIKENMEEIAGKLNRALVQEQFDSYAQGTISHYEIESMSFYYHPHELQDINFEEYGIEDFKKLPEEPRVERTIQAKDGKEIKLYELSCICGTVLDKNKLKNVVSLLTPTGVVNVKIWKNQFAKYDKQISEVQPDGKKKVQERSWFSRGNLLYLQGIRRGDSFIPKAYKNSRHKVPIMKILKVDGPDFIYTDKRYDE